jgi:hypothetical protein
VAFKLLPSLKLSAGKVTLPLSLLIRSQHIVGFVLSYLEIFEITFLGVFIEPIQDPLVIRNGHTQLRCLRRREAMWAGVGTDRSCKGSF